MKASDTADYHSSSSMIYSLSKHKETFIYLIYDPTELDIAIGIKEKIDSIYERLCFECNLIDFGTLFRTVLSYLNEKRYNCTLSDEVIEQLSFRFTFTLASQDFYPLLIN